MSALVWGTRVEEAYTPTRAGQISTALASGPPQERAPHKQQEFS